MSDKLIESLVGPVDTGHPTWRLVRQREEKITELEQRCAELADENLKLLKLIREGADPYTCALVSQEFPVLKGDSDE